MDGILRVYGCILAEILSPVQSYAWPSGIQIGPPYGVHQSQISKINFLLKHAEIPVMNVGPEKWKREAQSETYEWHKEVYVYVRTFLG